MRIIIALAAVASLAACSHNNPDTQPGPETGEVTRDTVQTRTPAGTVDTVVRPNAGTPPTSAPTPPPGPPPGPPPSANAPPPPAPTSPADTTSMRHDSV
jgi:hypothetical protein